MFLFTIQITFINKLFRAKPLPSQHLRGFVNLAWNRLLGDVSCSQYVLGISADESRDFSLTLLVDPVRGDTLARAAEHRRQQLQDDRSDA